MPSPFPGMDPYLEGHLWPDVHLSMLYNIRAQIAKQLPPGYFANLDEYIWLAESEEDTPMRRGKPDVLVGSNGTHLQASASSAVAVAISEPTTRVTFPEPETEHKKRYIRILDTKNQSVVTVLELLSPTDKRSGKKFRSKYLVKREEYLAAGANLVEIDLLRSGSRLPPLDETDTTGDYFFLVSDAERFPEADVWAFTVRDPIPVIPIPLKEGVPPIPLSIRICLEQAYESAYYGNRIDYTQPPVPPLRPNDAEWAMNLIK